MPWALLDVPWALLTLSFGFSSTLSCTGLAISWTLVASVAIWTQVSYYEALIIVSHIQSARKRLQPARKRFQPARRGSFGRPGPSLVLLSGSWALGPHSGPLGFCALVLISRVLGHEVLEMKTGTSKSRHSNETNAMIAAKRINDSCNYQGNASQFGRLDSQS